MKISVIIPVYNCEKYLPDCLESVLAQSFTELEIIVIDDGSTDKSGKICDEYAKKDARIQVIHQANRGVSASRNTGIEHMTGDLVSFIDADDTLDPDMYEFLYLLMNRYGADIVHCGYRHVVGEEIRLVHDTRKVVVQNQEEALQCLIGAKLFVGSLWNKLYKAELVKNLTFDENLKINEDILFNFLLFSKAKKTVFADYAKYNYIAHLDSSACFVTPDLKKSLDSCKVNQRIYEKSKGKSYMTAAAERYMRSLSGYYRVCSIQHQTNEKRNIRTILWQLYRTNTGLGKSMRSTAIMLRYSPQLYIWIYKIYDKLRKPNWEV